MNLALKVIRTSIETKRIQIGYYQQEEKEVVKLLENKYYSNEVREKLRNELIKNQVRLLTAIESKQQLEQAIEILKQHGNQTAI